MAFVFLVCVVITPLAIRTKPTVSYADPSCPAPPVSESEAVQAAISATLGVGFVASSTTYVALLTTQEIRDDYGLIVTEADGSELLCAWYVESAGSSWSDYDTSLVAIHPDDMTILELLLLSSTNTLSETATPSATPTSGPSATFAPTITPGSTPTE